MMGPQARKLPPARLSGRPDAADDREMSHALSVTTPITDETRINLTAIATISALSVKARDPSPTVSRFCVTRSSPQVGFPVALHLARGQETVNFLLLS